jgi:hypothetical protein
MIAHPSPLVSVSLNPGPRGRVKLAVSLAVMTVLSICPPAAAQLGARSTEEWLKTLESENRLANLKVW